MLERYGAAKQRSSGERWGKTGERFCGGRSQPIVIRTSLVEIGVTSMLAINENSVNAVLLNDGWHHPIIGTFRIHDIRLHADTSAGIDFGKVCAVWDEHACAAINTIVTITAPLASILALQRKK